MAEIIKIGDVEFKVFFGHRTPKLLNKGEIAVKIPKRANIDIHVVPDDKKKLYGFHQNKPVTVYQFGKEPIKTNNLLGLNIIGHAPIIDLSKPEDKNLGKLLLKMEKDWGWNVSPTSFAAVGLYMHGILTFIKTPLRKFKKT